MTTVVTRTIGASADYASFTAAEADIENIATSAFGGTDLVSNNGAIVFEVSAGTYQENFVIDHSLTCDSTRNVTFKNAGNGDVTVSSNVSSPVIQITNGAFTTLRGLNILSTGSGGGSRGVEIFPGSGKTCEGCVLDSLTIENNTTVNFVAFELQLEGAGSSGGAGSSANPTIVQNCVEKGIGSGFSIVGGKTDEIHTKVVNCTFAGTGFNTINIVTSNDVISRPSKIPRCSFSLCFQIPNR